MAGLIGTGQLYRKRALEGFTQVSNLENQRNVAQDGLDAQAQAQEMQLYGLGAGIGGAVGVKKAMAAKDAAGLVAPKGISAGTAAANAGKGVKGLQYTAGGLESLGPMGGTPPGAIETISGAAETAKLAGETSASVAKALGTSSAAGGGAAGGGAAAAGTTGAAAGTTGAAAGTTGAATGAAAGSSGAMATLGTIAAPIAIGIGAAFLLNKLFG